MMQSHRIGTGELGTGSIHQFGSGSPSPRDKVHLTIGNERLDR